MKFYPILALSLSFFISNGQDNQDVTTLYKNAMILYEKKETFKAIAEFEKIIKLDPNHTNSLYNLAIINYQLGDNATAIRLLRRCVKLNDKEAARLLQNQFHQKVSYADTMQNIDVSTKEKFIKVESLNIRTLSDLTKGILTISSSKKEQLQMLLLWSFNNMKADSNRFFNGGAPLSIEESFSRHKGLCEEYSNILEEFCRMANIPNFKITGYVKYPDFKVGDIFEQPNHAWNAVNIDNTWLICDLFWSTTALEVTNSSQPHFIKRLDTDYFLGLPSAFNNDHLPSDPVFQFDNYPIQIKSFTNKTFGIDSVLSRMNYLNFTDSIKAFSKMSPSERSLRSAHHSYLFNKDNPNELITESYNYAVEIINKKSSSKQELKNAKTSLTLALSIINLSKDEEIKALKDRCTTGLIWIDKKLTIYSP